MPACLCHPVPPDAAQNSKEGSERAHEPTSVADEQHAHGPWRPPGSGAIEWHAPELRRKRRKYASGAPSASVTAAQSHTRHAALQCRIIASASSVTHANPPPPPRVPTIRALLLTYRRIVSHLALHLER